MASRAPRRPVPRLAEASTASTAFVVPARLASGGLLAGPSAPDPSEPLFLAGPPPEGRPEHEGGVVAPEAQAVGHDVTELPAASRVRDVVEVTFGVRFLKVDRRGRHPGLQREDRDH